jgi:hypothetical protein
MEEKATLADIFDFTFTKFVTPIIIKIVFILLIVLVGLFWLIITIAGFAGGFASGLGAFIGGGIMFLLSIVGYRIMLELVMVVFAIKKNTDKMVA